MRGQERNVVTLRAGVTGSRHSTFSGASVDFRASWPERRKRHWNVCGSDNLDSGNNCFL